MNPKINRKLADSVYRDQFGAFCYAAFEILNPAQRLVPNWHIDVVCYQLERMVKGDSQKRLVINLPPRTLKSLIISVMLPAWLLGRNPGQRIICASYSEELAFKFSRDCRALIESPFFFGGYFRARGSIRKKRPSVSSRLRSGAIGWPHLWAVL
jgi:hypothetical protein